MRKLTLWIFILIGVILTFVFLPFAEAQTSTVTLTWEPNSEPDMSHYIVYWGTESRVYNWNSGDIGLVTIHSREITPPADAKTRYYFAVTAVDTSDLESDFSNEVFWDFDTRVPPAPPQNLKWYQKVISWVVKHLIFWA